MDNILEQLVTVPNLIFCIIIALLVMLQRKAVEKYWKNSKDSKLWNEFLLPCGPIATGGILAGFLKVYPFPDVFATHISNRIILGVICGLCSAHVYKIAKKWLVSKEAPDTQ